MTISSVPMKCFKVCVFILLYISVTLAFHNNYMYGVHKVDTRSTRHYCGNNLVRALHFLCESYNKRSSLTANPNIMSAEDQPNGLMINDDNIDEPNDTFSLFKTHINNDDNNNKQSMGLFHRTIRGVVDECCRRSCSITQLSQYCGVTRVTTTTVSSISE
ncbi:LIRP-like [Oppia nitens]|uniref:LIRP-like n=1 Tax=Oppia nitens TaxID=1686743 RepID=UPI0023D9C09B|nr:LIRP-like [Oppia nitens]